jgi:hypothetical protein
MSFANLQIDTEKHSEPHRDEDAHHLQGLGDYLLLDFDNVLKILHIKVSVVLSHLFRAMAGQAA